MSNTATSTLRLPTLAEIKANRAAKEAEAKVLLEETLPAALKTEILRYYCVEAQKQVAAGAKKVLVQHNFEEFRQNITTQFQQTYDGLIMVMDKTFSLIFSGVFSNVWDEIPKWVAELPGFEDYQINDSLLLQSKT